MVFTATFCISTNVICCRCHNMVFPVWKHAQFCCRKHLGASSLPKEASPVDIPHVAV